MLKDLRYALRMLRKNAAFTIVAICSLAIGIGSTSAMFSFADALLLRPLPVLEPSRVLCVNSASSAAFGVSTALSNPDYIDFRDRNRTFSGLVATAYTTFGFSPDPTSLPQMKFGLFVSGNLFHDLGVEPALGRGFRPDEDKVEGRDAVAVLGHDFWVSQYGASPSVLGSKVRLNGVEFTVVGVAPKSFTGIDNVLRPALFVPIAMSPRLGGANNLNNRDVRWLTVKGRLRPDATLEQAQADLNAIEAQLQKAYPQTNRDQKVTVQTELQMRVQQNPPNTALLAMLGLLAGCVLVVACANVAGLLLSRSRARSREVAIRLAIGAARVSLIRQLLIENVLLALGGGLFGTIIAFVGAKYFASLPIPSDLPIVLAVTVDRRVLLFTLVVSLLSTLLFGLTPALRTTRPDLVPALKAADADSAGKSRLWGRNSIVTGQVALSLVLLIISAVLLQGFRTELLQGPGYRTNHLYLTSFDTQLVHYNDDQARRFFRDLLERTRSAPGVKSAALTSVVPLIGGDGMGIVPEGYQLPHNERSLNIFDSYVGDGFFDTMNVRMLRGRAFRETDNENAPLVAVVEEHIAEHYWPHTDPIGKRFHMYNSTGPLVEIVGIAKQTKHFWIAEPPIDYVYLSYRQSFADRKQPRGAAGALARSALTLVTQPRAGESASVAPEIREIVRNLDPNMPVYDARTMEDLYNQRAVKTPNMIADTVAGLGLMGLILSMVGLYGLIAYSVSRRTREIGIRMAIGADRLMVIKMVLQQGFVLGAIGVGIGLVFGIIASRLVTSSSLFIATFTGVSPLLFVVIALPLLAITLLATYAPARRASLIDPMKALRDE